MNTSSPLFVEHSNVTSKEIDLCDLLRSLRLSTEKKSEDNMHDVLMAENPNHSIPEYSSSSLPPSDSDGSHGCAYVQSIRQQLDNFSTTGGEYLETIFTHREIVSALPSAHYQCARGFSDIAYMLEQRAWRSDRDADLEAVAAFRYEAWSIAASLPSLPKQGLLPNLGSSYICMMPAM